MAMKCLSQKKGKRMPKCEQKMLLFISTCLLPWWFGMHVDDARFGMVGGDDGVVFVVNFSATFRSMMAFIYFVNFLSPLPIATLRPYKLVRVFFFIPRAPPHYFRFVTTKNVMQKQWGNCNLYIPCIGKFFLFMAAEYVNTIAWRAQR